MADKETSLERADLAQPGKVRELTELSQSYFQWMDQQITGLCGFSIPDIVNMPLADYVEYTVAIGCKIEPEEGGVYFIRGADGKAFAMGGLRRLPDGSAEIVRIYTRPQARGHGLGKSMVQGLIDEARRLGYREIRLDTGVFMKEAQRIYAAAGFTPCEQYAGAEPPEALTPYWLYMKRSLAVV